MDDATARPRLLPLRIGATVLAALAGPPAAVVAGFAAAIEGSGCFIECNAETDHPNPTAGLLLGLLSFAFAVSGPLIAWVLLRRAVAVVLALVPAVAVALLLAGA